MLTYYVHAGIIFLALLFASPAQAIDRAGEIKVGDVITVNGACTRDGIFSILNGQKAGGAEGFRKAINEAEMTGRCIPFRGPIDVEVREIEHYGMLDDGDNFLLSIGNGLWVVHVLETTGS